MVMSMTKEELIKKLGGESLALFIRDFVEHYLEEENRYPPNFTYFIEDEEGIKLEFVFDTEEYWSLLDEFHPMYFQAWPKYI